MNSTGNSAGNRLLVPILTGPTASGKSSAAYEFLEKHPGFELISADSRQIYKYLNIGTDKPTPEEINKYRIGLVDFVEPDRRYTVFDFTEDAHRVINEIRDRGHIPLICGGTGLYIRALVEGIVEIPEEGMEIRRQLEEEAITLGPQYLYEKLEKIDKTAAEATHPHNLKRIIRALEIYELTGRTKTEILAGGNQPKGEYNFEIICLNPPREILYERINQRVDLMMEKGLMEEIRILVDKGFRPSLEKLNVIGYNELLKHLDGVFSLEAAINLVKQNSRRYAKRQVTWFKGMSGIVFCRDAGEVQYQLERLAGH